MSFPVRCPRVLFLEVSNSRIICKLTEPCYLSGLTVGSSPEVDMAIARDEIARAHRLAPEIVPENPSEDSLSHIIGIRPSRQGGFRLDCEKMGQRTVLSAYGFGGGGYAFSYGVADALAKMVEKAERENVIL